VVVSEALIPFGQGRPFEKGAIALEALSEATNGDADGVVMNPACQLTKLLDAQPTAGSTNEKGGLACAGATRIPERQNVLQTSQVLFRRIWVSLAMVFPFKDSVARPLNPAAPRSALSNCRIPLAGLRRSLASRYNSSSSQGSFQTLLTACTIWVQVSASTASRLTPIC